MTLAIRRKPDGSLASGFGFADFKAHGKRHVIPLGVAIEGKVPASLRDAGDRTFEKSRGDAQSAHDKAVADARLKTGEQRLLERIIEIKTSDKVKSVALDALPSGLPMELVRRITGHTTVDVVLKHYFRPGREQFRAAMQKAMPATLTNGNTKTNLGKAIEIIEGMNGKTLKHDRAKVLELLKA